MSHYLFVPKELFPDHPNSGDQDNPPIFVKLLDDPFIGWIIALEEIKLKAIENGSEDAEAEFSYSVQLVPKNITDDKILELRDSIRPILSEVVHDILIRTIEHYEKEKNSS